MMYLFYGIFLILCLYKMKPKPPKGEKFMTDYMSVEKTMSMKGIFIIIVFFSHFNSYVKFTDPMDITYSGICRNMGQAMVTLFLFYSGYGVMEAIKKKGMGYVHKIPLTRILGTYFRFDIAVLMFIILQTIRGYTFPVSQYLLSFTGWEAVGNSNWYVFVIIIAYLVTFLAFEIFRDKLKYYPAALLVTAGCVGYIALLYAFELKPAYWFDTIICYALGVWFSLLRGRIEKIVTKNLFVYSLFLTGLILATQYCYVQSDDGFAYSEGYLICFALFFIVLSMRVSLHNKFLMWCGKNLFGLYIMQRIPMIIFKAVGVADFNVYLYFILCAAVTVPVAWVFEKYTGKLWKIITSPRKKTA